MRRSVFIKVLLAATILGSGGSLACQKNQSADAREKLVAGMEVKIENFSFSPPTLTVSAGESVIWINRDDTPHTVMSADKVFKSKALDTDERFSYTFSKPGEYAYFCSLHPKMTGKVIVQ